MVSTLEQAIAGGAGVQPVRFHFERRTKANVFISDDVDSAIRRDSGNISMDVANASVRTCALAMDIALLPAGINFAVDHIAAFMDLLVNGAFVSTQIGLFRIDSIRRTYRPPAIGTIEAEGADVSYHLLRAKSAAPVTVAVSANIMDAVRAEIAAEGLSVTGLPVLALLMPVARTWAPGTSRWQRVVDLCRAINYYDPWARGDGSFTTRERIDPSTEAASVTYSTTVAPLMVRSPYEATTEETSAPNRFAVLIDHPTRTPEYALRQNDDPNSPVSTVVTGIVTNEEYSNDLMLNVTVAGQYAAFELQAAASLATQSSLRTAIDPRRDAHETYLLNIAGVEESTRWRQIGWKFPIRVGGEMEHDIASAAPVVIVVGT